MSLILSFIKKYWPLFAVAAIICWAIFSIIKLSDLSSQVKQQMTNIIQIEEQNSNLIFANDQLREYLEIQNTREKKMIDSLAKVYDIKLKNIKQAQTIHIHYVDTVFHIKDSTVVRYETVRTLEDTMFAIPFSLNKDCYFIDGEIISRDSLSTINFNKVEFTDDIVRIKFTKKKWWRFWEWCKPAKVEYVTFGRCSNVTFKNFEEER